MCLPPAQVNRFYSIWKPLLLFANRQLKLIPALYSAGADVTLQPEDAFQLREGMWKKPALLDDFVSQNPFNLPADALAQAASWKLRVAGKFYIYKNLKKHAIFIDDGARARVYAVKGLSTPFEEMIPFFPILVDTVLLPFDGEIVSDGLYNSYNITFGRGITGNLKDMYDDAKERDAIITSFVESKPSSPLEQVKKARATNVKVLEGFEKYLLKTSTSLKSAVRDMNIAEEFAAYCVELLPSAHSLRDIGQEELTAYLKDLPPEKQHQAAIAFKRFFQYMIDSARIDWEQGEQLIDLMKEWK